MFKLGFSLSCFCLPNLTFSLRPGAVGFPFFRETKQQTLSLLLTSLCRYLATFFAQNPFGVILICHLSAKINQPQCIPTTKINSKQTTYVNIKCIFSTKQNCVTLGYVKSMTPIRISQTHRNRKLFPKDIAKSIYEKLLNRGKYV